MISLLGSIVLGGMLIAYAISVLSPDPKLALISETAVITLPYLILICLTAILGAALNGLGKFASPAAAPILLNVVLIASAFASPLAQSERAQLWILSGAVIVGGFVQLAIQIPPLAGCGLRFRPVFAKDDSLREILAAFLPAVVGLGVIQINEFCDNLIAELLVKGDGAVSAIYYANRLNQLPLGIIGFSVATAAFPRLSSDAAKGDLAGLSDSLSQAMRLSLWVAIPAAAGLMILPKEITALLFERLKFDSAATARTFPVVLAYAIGIPFYAANMVLTRAFYSLRDMKTPVRVSLTTVGLNLVLNIFFVLLLDEAGIALATSITGLVNFILLQIYLRRRIPVPPRGTAYWTLRVVLSAALSAAAAYAVYHGIGPDPARTLDRAVHTGVSIAAAIGVFFTVSVLLRLPEARQILGVLRRRPA
jgi:putative peptidoglycan lipid II flippase